MLLDASHAFDRVEYCTLFKTLLDKGLCPVVCRLFAFMYMDQKIRRWEDYHSEYFPVTNGVKQGGILSPILFSLCIDDLLTNLGKSGSGCYIGVTFIGSLVPQTITITFQVPSYHFYPLEIRHQKEKTGRISKQSLATCVPCSDSGTTFSRCGVSSAHLSPRQ
jgi:hypothetical protein